MNCEPVEQGLGYSCGDRGELPAQHTLAVVAECRVARYR